jgi:hypothetical protein
LGDLQDMTLHMELTLLSKKALRDRHGTNWIVAERSTMRAVVNAARQERGLPEITLRDIERVEYSALISSRLSESINNFAFGCAKLALGVEE